MTDFVDTENAQVLKLALKDLLAIRGLNAADIEELTVTVKTTTSQTFNLKATPSDAGWGATLTALNTVVLGKVNAVKAALVALAVTNIPA